MNKPSRGRAQPMDPEAITEVVNGNLAEGRRPIRSITNPGDVNQQVAEILARELPTEEVVAVIRKLLHAKRRNKQGEEEDDIRAMEAGAKLAMAYKVGLPIQRQEIRTETVNGENDALMRVLASPAALKSIKNLFDQAEAAGKVESVPEKQA